MLKKSSTNIYCLLLADCPRSCCELLQYNVMTVGYALNGLLFNCNDRVM